MGADSSGGDFNYELPADLIAQDPPTERGASRLLLLEREGSARGIVPFATLPRLLCAGDLLVINDSRVLPARLHTRRTDTGGQVEILLVHPVPEISPLAWQALARPARRLRAGQQLAVLDPGRDVLVGPLLDVVATAGDGTVVLEPDTDNLTAVADRWGEMPLPPYIRREAGGPLAEERLDRDRARYQTVYARADGAGAGSVAAPTAGLHFTDVLLAGLEATGIEVKRLTLHVGPGTFRPPSADQIASRRLHPEAFEYPAQVDRAVVAARREGRRVVAVGTTTLRVLQTVANLGLPSTAGSGDEYHWPAAAGGATVSDPVFSGRATRESAGWRIAGTTRLFVRPPESVTAADGLLTNFHLPESSLLMLLEAFTGQRSWRDAYAEAIARRLRFYSYGDAMLVLPSGGFSGIPGSEET